MTKTQQTFKPGDKVIITVPEGTIAGEREPGGEYIDRDMLDWTEGYIDRCDATIHKNNSIRVYKPDGSDYWNFPVSWLKLKNPPEDAQEPEEQKKLPDSFSFKTALRSDYKAEWNESRGWFFISWNDGIGSTTYTKEQAEGAVQRGNWVIIEEFQKRPEEQPTEETQQEITPEEIDKLIANADEALTHLYNIKDAIKSCKALGYKLTKA